MDHFNNQAATVIATWSASTWHERARGLIGMSEPQRGCALHLKRTSAVHGCFMSYPIDLVYLNDKCQVLTVRTLRPWRFSWVRGARSVLEMRHGEARRMGLKPGSQIIEQALRCLKTSQAEPVSDGKFGASHSTSLRCLVFRFIILAVTAACVLWSEAVMSDERPTMGAVVPSGLAPTAPDWIRSLWSRLTPDTRGRMSHEAEQHYQDRALSSAMERFQNIYATDPDRRVQALLRIGNIHQLEGRDADALQAYVMAQSQVPSAEAHELEHVAFRKAQANLVALASHRAGFFRGDSSKIPGQSAALESDDAHPHAVETTKLIHSNDRTKSAIRGIIDSPGRIDLGVSTARDSPHETGPTITYLSGRSRVTSPLPRKVRNTVSTVVKDQSGHDLRKSEGIQTGASDALPQ